jgi:protein-S-isoprenylcysteine O-methyltransferase Ste14
MSSLELKIPPPAVALAFGIVMWLVAMLTQAPHLSVPFTTYAGILLALLGQGVGIAGMVAFRKAKTTINPVSPANASSLVARGIFRYTRNPMYVGWLLTLLGWAAYLSSLFSVLFVPLFMLYIQRCQIEPEERALAQKFGKEYAAYKSAVRRWL